MHHATRSTARIALGLLCAAAAGAQQPEPEVPPGAGAEEWLPPPDAGPPVPVASDGWGFGGNLGLRQRAWDDPEASLGKGQQWPGYREVVYDPRRMPVIELRTGMDTMIVLEEWVEAEWARIGDQHWVEVTIPEPNVIVLKSKAAGVDTSLQVKTRGGRMMGFVVRGNDHTMETTPDLKVRVVSPAAARGDGVVYGPGRAGTTGTAAAGHAWSGRSMAPGAAGEDRYNTGGGDHTGELDRLQARMAGRIDARPGQRFANLETAAHDPARLSWDFDVWVKDEASKAIVPLSVRRDDHFTYLDYGAKIRSLKRHPAVHRVVDGTEQQVSVRWAGADNEVLVAETTGHLTLISGQLRVCIYDMTQGWIPERIVAGRTEARQQEPRPPAGAPAPPAAASTAMQPPAPPAAAGTAMQPPAAAMRMVGRAPPPAAPAAAQRTPAAGAPPPPRTARRVDVVADGGPAGTVAAILAEAGPGWQPAEGEDRQIVPGVPEEVARGVCGRLLQAGAQCRLRPHRPGGR